MNSLAFAGGTESYLLNEPDEGSSKEALHVAAALAEVYNHYVRSWYLGGRLTKALELLDDAVEESSSPNWDGYGAVAVNPGSVAEARRFLRVLPPRLAPNEVAVDPDGEVSFDWIFDDRTLSVSIADHRSLDFACVLGLKELHGTIHFDYEVPQEIIRLIREVPSAQGWWD